MTKTILYGVILLQFAETLLRLLGLSNGVIL